MAATAEAEKAGTAVVAGAGRGVVGADGAVGVAVVVGDGAPTEEAERAGAANPLVTVGGAAGRELAARDAAGRDGEAGPQPAAR